MRRLSVQTAQGHARVSVALPDATAEPFVDECLKWSKRASGVRATFAGTEVVLKGGPIASSGARRHGLRRALLGAPAPSEAEFRNLRWLGERLFRAAEPIAAVTIFRAGRPVRQLLATRAIDEATPFEDAWAAADDETRRAWAEELGRELGRMHALRFFHGDLYPRNVLVVRDADDGGPGHGRALAWLDAWAGGPTAWRRGVLRPVEQDLGAWFSVAADWMDADAQRALLTAYFAARAANGRPVRSEGALVASAQRARRVEMRRLERERRRLRGRPFPLAGWDPPVGDGA